MQTRIKIQAFTYFLLLAFGLNAQTIDKTDNSLGSIVITGSKHPENSLKVPSFITIITEKEIRESGALTVDEAISRIGGIPSRPSLYGGNELNLDLGGFAELAASNQIIIIDGIQYKQGDSSENRLSYIPLDQVERIEIQRGASSVLYGNGAVGGVINIITKTTSLYTEKPSANLYTSYGSFGTSDTRGTVTYGIKNFSLIFSGTNRQSDGYRHNSASKERDGKFTLKHQNKFFLSSVYLETTDLDARTPGALNAARLSENPRSINPIYKNDYWNNAVNQVGGYLETDIYGTVIQLNARHQDRLIRYVSTFSNGSSSFARAKSTIDVFDLNAKNVINTSFGKNTLIAGTSQNFWSMTSTSTTLGPNSGASKSNAIYAQNDFKFSESDTLLRLGYRSENFTQSSLYLAIKSEIFNLHASEIAIMQPINKFNSLYIRRAKSYSLPNTDAIGNTAAPAIRLVPQTGFDREIGWKFNSALGTKFDLRYYISDVSNEISYAYQPSAGYFANFNLPQTQRNGINFFGEFILLKDLTIGGAVNIRRAIVTAGNYNGKTSPLNPNTLSLSSKYRINSKQSIGGQWNYFSSQIIGGDYANSLQRIPNYNTLDLRYSYNYAKNIDYSLSIKNLMNTNYYSYAVTSDATTVSYYPDPRRSFMASARFMFD